MSALVAVILLGAGRLDESGDVRFWVDRLRADSIEEREGAVEAILALGERARPYLEKAAHDVDSEVACRSRELLSRLNPGHRGARALVGHWLRGAIRSFDGERYVECIRFCDAILEIDPAYPVALSIRHQAERACHAHYAASICGMFFRWEAETCARGSFLPLDGQLRIPSPEAWPTVRSRATAKAPAVPVSNF